MCNEKNNNRLETMNDIIHFMDSVIQSRGSMPAEDLVAKVRQYRNLWQDMYNPSVE